MTKTTTFLLVEDDPNDATLLAMEFRKCPAQIRLLTVGDGQQAMDFLDGLGAYSDRERYPLPDVILLDLKMPRINGFEFLEWLRGRSARHLRLIPVVVMSSSGLKEDVDRAYALGANSYMVKPIEWRPFRERVKALGIYWSEHVEVPASRAA